jgi:hypothetical protein
MRQALPPLTDHAAELTSPLRRARERQQPPRLPRLSLLASGHAPRRQAVAPRLGVQRHPMGRWLASYAAGGRAALRAPSGPAGTPVALAPEVLGRLEAARRPWGRRTPGGAGNCHPLSAIVRPRFRAKLNVPRPRHPTPSCGAPCMSGGLPRAPATRPPAGGPPAGAGLQAG